MDEPERWRKKVKDPDGGYEVDLMETFWTCDKEREFLLLHVFIPGGRWPGKEGVAAEECAYIWGMLAEVGHGGGSRIGESSQTLRLSEFLFRRFGRQGV